MSDVEDRFRKKFVAPRGYKVNTKAYLVLEFIQSEIRKAKEESFNTLETRFITYYDDKSIAGQLKAAFNDHKGMGRRELIPSVSKRILGGIRGLVLQIIDEERNSLK